MKTLPLNKGTRIAIQYPTPEWTRAILTSIYGIDNTNNTLLENRCPDVAPNPGCECISLKMLLLQDTLIPPDGHDNITRPSPDMFCNGHMNESHDCDKMRQCRAYRHQHYWQIML